MIGKPENSGSMMMKQLLLMISTGLLCSLCVFAADEGAPERLQELLALTPAQLAAMDADEREAVAQEVDALLVDNTKAAMALNQQLDETKEQVRQTDPMVKEIDLRIRNLRQQIGSIVDENPQVVAANEQFSAQQSQVLNLMKLKRQLMSK